MNPGWCGKVDKRLDAIEQRLTDLEGALRATDGRVQLMTPEGLGKLRVELARELAILRDYVKRATGRRK